MGLLIGEFTAAPARTEKRSRIKAARFPADGVVAESHCSAALSSNRPGKPGAVAGNLLLALRMSALRQSYLRY